MNKSSLDWPKQGTLSPPGGSPSEAIIRGSIPWIFRESANWAPSTSLDRESSSPTRLCRVEFRLEAPCARDVKVAGDFTDWEMNPLDLIPDDDGTWELVLALPPARYAYRFIVDGEWCDDPQCTDSEPSPYGTMNAVVEAS